VPGLRRLYYWWVKDATQPSELIPDVDATPRRALEIGCANGDFLVRLRDAGWDVRGVEICEAPTLRAQRRGLDVRVGTLESAAYANASFDAVFAWGAVPHLRDPLATFREIHRVLKPGAWFLFSFPNAACWELRFFRQYWYGLQVPTQMQHYTPDAAAALLRRTGFEIVELTHLEDINNLIGSLGIWLRAGLPDLGCGKGLYEFTSRWAFLLRVALAPLARLLAYHKQAGRIRIAARRQR
jgi:SAM-dependent methyltransferase